MFKAKVAPFFGSVAMKVEIEGEEKTVFFEPEQAKALAKALGKAARAAEKAEG